MTPKLPFRVGEYADEIEDSTGRVVMQMTAGSWVCEIKKVILTPDEVALRDFVIEACNSRSASTREDSKPNKRLTATANNPVIVGEGDGPASTQSGTESNSFSGSTITDLEALVERAEAK